MKKSYAQHGEDILIEQLLINYFKKPHPFTYLDIGCNHPVNDSNTYFFYEKGGQGICIDPNPKFAALYGEHRERDVFINTGIQFDDRTEAIYYDFGENSGLNTFDARVGESVEKNWAHMNAKLQRIIPLPLANINKILAQHFPETPPDILSVDCEGVDFRILQSMDFTMSHPNVVCVEVDKHDVRVEENNMHTYLLGHGYVLAARTIANYIYISIYRDACQETGHGCSRKTTIPTHSYATAPLWNAMRATSRTF